MSSEHRLTQSRSAGLRAVALAILLVSVGASQSSDVTRPLLSGGPVGSEQIPFAPGERVRYEVNWKPLFLTPSFKAGDLSVTVENTAHDGKPALKISALASSDGILRTVAGLEVRDYFESIIDRRDFRSYRFLYQRRQNERKRDLEIVADYAKNELRVTETDVSGEPRILRSRVLQGLPGLLVDSLSVFYVARLHELKPGEQYQLDLNDSGRLRDVTVRVEKSERISTPLGPYDVSKVVTEQGIFSGGGHLRIWYSNDRFRIPVRFEADAKIGKVFGQLVQIDAGKESRGRIRTN